eukprot:Lithocolla_globosa_v1_NODE_9019_length_756_cov_12.828816.p2 type:complete len:162 gc:universal NODE_9019_length_756_cov_12.828816:706-221(-)
MNAIPLPWILAPLPCTLAPLPLCCLVRCLVADLPNNSDKLSSFLARDLVSLTRAAGTIDVSSRNARAFGLTIPSLSTALEIFFFRVDLRDFEPFATLMVSSKASLTTGFRSTRSTFPRISDWGSAAFLISFTATSRVPGCLAIRLIDFMFPRMRSPVTMSR